MAETPRPLRLGLVGWPLGTSLSPLVHGIFLEEARLPGEYRLYPVEPSGLAAAILTLAREGVLGLNVTHPHKRTAAGLCSRLDDAAEAVGAVNTLTFRSDGILGGNTDACGFREAIRALGLEAPFLIAGCGGAALAVERALREAGLAYAVFCRNPGAWRGTARAEPLQSLGGAAAVLGSGTVVNATPLGWGDGDPFPADAASLRGLAFFDLNYHPGWRWRNGLAGAVSPIHTGEVMLVFQAAESFRLWTGYTPSTGTALAAVSAWMTDGGGAGS